MNENFQISFRNYSTLSNLKMSKTPSFTVLFSLGNLDASYRYLERALVLKRMIFGNDDEQISNTMHLIGKVQGKSGEKDDALDSLKEGR